MARKSTAGVLQPLIPKMSLSHTQPHAPRTYSACEKSCSNSSVRNGCADCGYDQPQVHCIVRYSIAKVACLALVIAMSTVWWLSDHQVFTPHDREAAPLPITPSRQRFARAPTSSLLGVFQIHSPVLTVGSDGTLDITDDSTRSGSGTNSSGHAVCEEVLVVHSFAYSYGQPFIGNYTAPRCKFNRVTWNITVVSAGRQFDRLGIIYLGDIEVFRTSTAEPTANGIRWTYLKVSHTNQYPVQASDWIHRI